MQIFLDCLPCFLRQALAASRMATAERALHEKVLAESLKTIEDYRSYRTAPEVGRAIHNLVKKLTKNPDPYKRWKTDSIKAANQVYPMLESFFNQQEDRVYWGLKIAGVGNIMDAAVYGDIDLEKLIVDELEKPFKIDHSKSFKRSLQSAKVILIIGDNAGETVFDRFFLEKLIKLGDYQVYYAVRSEPVINDVTWDEAVASGLERVATIINSGSSSPGLILKECTPEFLALFNCADLVISKGQGNYETLSNVQREVFFLFKAKCSVIADHIGVPVNEYVLKSSGIS